MGKIRRICDDKVGAAGVILVLVLVAHTGFGGFPGDAVPFQHPAQALLPRGHHADNNIAEFIAAAFKQGGGVQHAGAAAGRFSGIHAGFALRQDKRKSDADQPAQFLRPGENNGAQCLAVDGAIRQAGAGEGRRDGRGAGGAVIHPVGDGIGIQDCYPAPAAHEGGNSGFAAAGGAGQADAEHGITSVSGWGRKKPVAAKTGADGSGAKQIIRAGPPGKRRRAAGGYRRQVPFPPAPGRGHTPRWPAAYPAAAAHQRGSVPGRDNRRPRRS